MTMNQATSPGLVPVGESFRERVARHVAGDSELASNFDLIAQAIASGAVEEPSDCPDCDGLGFRALSAKRLAVWAGRVAEERRLWQQQIDELTGEAKSARQDPEWHGRQLAELRQKLAEQTKRLRYQCNRESVCNTCEGSGKLPGSGDEGAEVLHDSVWTTVPCPYCSGRNCGRDGSVATGTSTGEIWDRDDAAADRYDVCPKCIGEDGQGRGYIVPITARPKTSSPDFTGDYVTAIDDIPHQRRCWSEQAETVAEADEAERFLDSTREGEPLLAAAVAVLNGPRGDEWAGHLWGRRFALWPLTEAGKRLDAEATERHHGGDEYTRSVATLTALRVAEVQVERGNPHDAHS